MNSYAQILDSLIIHWTNQCRVPRSIIWAILWHESVAATHLFDLEKSQWAARPEKGFYGMYLRNRPYSTLAGYKPPVLPNATGEKLMRAASYGHMQIMGETARVLGCRVQFLTELCSPQQNIEWGVKAFAKHYHHEKAPKEEAERVRFALQRYNGGGDPDYYIKVDKVRRNAPWSKLLPLEPSSAS